jgi:GNAT superfamily N-acetyltransferase
MDHELELSKANRLKLARVFRDLKRVDFSIDCVIEGQMGRAFVDDPAHPAAYRITIGPFWYFAGDALGPGGYQMMKDFPAYHLLMPSSPGWVELAGKIFGGHLQSFTRYSFSSANLSSARLAQCLQDTPYQSKIIPIDAEIAARLAQMPESYLEVSDFESVQDFIERGIGFTILDGSRVMGVAYSSLVCSTGLEISIYIEAAYRQKGLATALGSRLLLESLERGLRPNWDAANPESCLLAKKLGYTFVEAYHAYYHTVK